jgi:hypothetical protein
MAEIRIQRERHHTWIWLVAILIVLASLAWLAFGRSNEADDGAQMGLTLSSPGELASAAPTTDPLPGAVNDYLQFTADNRASRDADHTHAYTSEGIRRLAAALGVVAERDGRSDENVSAKVETLRERADALQRNPQSMEHARYARDAFDAAAELMRALQTPSSSAAVAEVTRAAGALQPGTMLLQQPEAVQRFFDQSATALRAMLPTASS